MKNESLFRRIMQSDHAGKEMKGVLESSNVSYTKAAESMGLSSSTFNDHLTRKTVRSSNFVKRFSELFGD